MGYSCHRIHRKEMKCYETDFASAKLTPVRCIHKKGGNLMQYGYFDDAAREYVITEPQTPSPWINYLGSEAFFTLMSNTSGGYSFYKDAKLRRITR